MNRKDWRATRNQCKPIVDPAMSILSHAAPAKNILKLRNYKKTNVTAGHHWQVLTFFILRVHHLQHKRRTFRHLLLHKNGISKVGQTDRQSIKGNGGIVFAVGELVVNTGRHDCSSQKSISRTDFLSLRHVKVEHRGSKECETQTNSDASKVHSKCKHYQRQQHSRPADPQWPATRIHKPHSQQECESMSASTGGREKQQPVEILLHAKSFCCRLVCISWNHDEKNAACAVWNWRHFFFRKRARSAIASEHTHTIDRTIDPTARRRCGWTARAQSLVLRGRAGTRYNMRTSSSSLAALLCMWHAGDYYFRLWLFQYV